MKKVFAFMAFVHHYLSYQIPMQLMFKAIEDQKKAADEINQENFIEKTDEALDALNRFTKWSEVVNYHQAKCDEYREIFESA